MLSIFILIEFVRSNLNILNFKLLNDIMRLVLTTIPIDKSEKLKTKIIEEKLAGCVIDVGLLTPSKFWWKGKIDKENESLIIFKTRKELVKKLFTRIKELHPYSIPFIAEIKVENVNKEYYKWLKEVTEKYNKKC